MLAGRVPMSGIARAHRSREPGAKRGVRAMKRMAGVVAAALLAIWWLVPSALASDGTFQHTGRVLISVKGDATLPAGEHADVVVVVQGAASIAGEANVVIVVDGSANLQGAHVDSLVAIRSPVTLGPGTMVTNVRTVDSSVTQDPTATVSGSVRDATTDLAAFGLAVATGFFLLFLGLVIAVILGALLVAALAARQVRAAETLISREPVKTFVIGLVSVFVIPIVAVLALVSVIGLPVGLAILFGLWPLSGFAGYVVSAIWIGDWLLHRAVGDPARRPYAEATIGVLILAILSAIPVLGVVSAIAGLFGFGAVLLLVWRTLRGTSAIGAPAPPGVPPPTVATPVTPAST
jgi:hypothetical protein